MKKFFTTLFMVLGVYALTQAQSKNQNEFGVNIGINSAYVISNSNYASQTGLIAGLNAGISFNHYFSDQWSLKVKAIYDPKGWGNGYIQTGTKTVTGVNYPLTYLTVPVMANWHFGSQKNWYANAGPYVGFLLSAKDDYDNADLKSSFNNTDVGAALGLGIKFPVSNKLKIFFEYDGQIGFANILKNTTSANGAQSVRSGFNVGLNF